MALDAFEAVELALVVAALFWSTSWTELAALTVEFNALITLAADSEATFAAFEAVEAATEAVDAEALLPAAIKSLIVLASLAALVA